LIDFKSLIIDENIHCWWIY